MNKVTNDDYLEPRMDFYIQYSFFLKQIVEIKRQV
jgi:hypothetical protein